MDWPLHDHTVHVEEVEDFYFTRVIDTYQQDRRLLIGGNRTAEGRRTLSSDARGPWRVSGKVALTSPIKE